MIVDISQSSSTTINQRARLISPVITPNGEQCVEFWYYSDADSLSSTSKLSVYVRPTTPASSTSSYLIWSKNMHQVSDCSSCQIAKKGALDPFQERQWRISQQRVPYGLSLTPYQVLIEGMVFRSGADLPIIAIDDVFIRDRACLEPGDCDFENG